jgi:hypothetical protein
MSEVFLGVQLGSHSIYDEGIDRCLDNLQQTAGINALFVYATTYQGFSRGRAVEALASDHGAPVKRPADRDLTEVWFGPHDEYYAGTYLRHRRRVGEVEFADRDVLAELAEPARKRGIKLYARILEGFGSTLPALIPNWPKILSVDVYGRLTHLPCWNHPDYRNWWLSTVEDLFKSYPLDGFKFGSERSGPLTNLLVGAHHGVTVPACFCEHCLAKGRAQGIRGEQARLGFQRLHELVSGLLDGQPAPVDGILVTLLRILFRYPEVLAWERLWHESRTEACKQMYSAIKLIRPEAQVGWHLYHNGTTWLVLDRALTEYAEMVHYSDWLKPVVYHDIAGPRIHRDVANAQARILREFSKPQILELLYDVMGYDAQVEPDYEELSERGLSPDYVYRETLRCVRGVQGKIPVYPGLGFDIPWHGAHFYSDPERVYQAALRAFEAGASGLIVSREYDEMRLVNLRAIGRAVRDAQSAGI